MKCVIPGTNARVFAKAVQSLAKVGPDLFIEADADGFSLRTVNSSRSAFALFRFSPCFFLDYDLEVDGQDDFENKCKVSMKACLGAFKNMKTVENCIIIIDTKKSKFIVQLKCRLDTIKNHSVSIIDVETLQAVYMTDNVPNKITGTHKIFTEISNNFQMNEEEITIEAGKENMTIKNYVEGSHVDRRFMRSQLTLKEDEFEKYQIREETSITFCLREFRALLNFAESLNLEMILQFETAGSPVVFILKSVQTFEANLVMSTLSPDDITTCETSLKQNQSFGNSINESVAQKLSKTTIEDNSKLSSNNNDVSIIPSKKRINEKRVETQVASKKTRIEPSTADNNEHNENTDTFMLRDGTTISNTKIQINSENVQPSKLLSRVNDKTFTDKNAKNGKTDVITIDNDDIYITFKDTPEFENIQKGIVPKSPEADRKKRVRKIFKRCFEATFDPAPVVNVTDQILAKNSDTED